MIRFEEVEGENRGDVTLFALSTCVWCKRTKQLLENLGVAYKYVFVDLAEGEEKEEVMEEVKRINPRCSYPTLSVGDDHCIVGFKKELIKEALGYA